MTTVQFPREPDDALYEYLAEVCGGGADEIWEGLCTRFGGVVPETWQEQRTGLIRLLSEANGRVPDSDPLKNLIGAIVMEERLRGGFFVEKYDDTLLSFLALMRNELHANSHKGDREAWLRMTLEQALGEVGRHMDKLLIPVLNQDREAIREHVADVANCAMMLADIAGVLSRE